MFRDGNHYVTIKSGLVFQSVKIGLALYVMWLILR
jgi:hypothetical protein